MCPLLELTFSDHQVECVIYAYTLIPTIQRYIHTSGALTYIKEVEYRKKAPHIVTDAFSLAASLLSCFKRDNIILQLTREHLIHRGETCLRSTCVDVGSLRETLLSTIL